jgi:acyl-CoA synthetase (AMP-forming)/AMP-acid ligase II
MNVTQLLETQAKKYAQKPALIFKEQPITFRELRDISFCLANSLLELGVKKGEKVAIYLPNWPEYIYSYLAVWCLGLTAVPLDFMLTEDEIISCLSHSEASVLIAKPKINISLPNIRQNCPSLKHVITCSEKVENSLFLQDLLEKGKATFTQAEVQDKDYAIIFYTSGTTGKPKGVLISYLQLEAPARAMSYFVDLSDKDTILCALPFSHLGGLVFIQGILFLGAKVVLMERFIPSEFLKNVQNHKVNCFWLVPSMYYALLQLKEFEVFDLSSLNWVCSFGAPSSADQLRRFNKYCPQAYLYHGWGMTETQGPSVVTPKGFKNIESVGRPAPWVEVKIFDDNDCEVVVGQVGEIVVRSWVVTDGYYKDTEATALAFRNGWFHTGDLGKLDSEGNLYIAGRKKEMIKVGGEIVFEPEVEAAIHKHPEIAEVAVIGVPDTLRGETPKAFIVLKEGSALSEEDLRYFCRQHLAHFKVPHYFEFVRELPKNRTGKIDKEKLRKGL